MTPPPTPHGNPLEPLHTHRWLTEARRKGQKNAGLLDPDPIVQAAVTQLESFRQEHRVNK